MAQQQLGLSFRSVSTANATSQAAGFPATNAYALPTKWRQTLRSTAVGTWNLDIDFGSILTLDGLFLHNCNFGKVMLARGDNGSTWTNMYSAVQDTLFDVRCAPPARRKTWYPKAAWLAPFNNRWLRITPSVPDAGATYYEIGSVAFPVVEDMVRNWGVPLSPLSREGVTRLSFAGVGSEVNVEAPTVVQLSVQGGPWTNNALSQLQRLRGLGQDGAFFLFFNRGSNAEAYLMKRTADGPFAHRQVTFDAPFELEECI